MIVGKSFRKHRLKRGLVGHYCLNCIFAFLLFVLAYNYASEWKSDKSNSLLVRGNKDNARLYSHCRFSYQNK